MADNQAAAEARGWSPLETSVFIGVLFFIFLMGLESWGQASFLTKDLPPGGEFISKGLELCMSDIMRFFATVFLLYMVAGAVFGAGAHVGARALVGAGRGFRLVFVVQLFLISLYLTGVMAVVHPQFFAIKSFYRFLPVDFITGTTTPLTWRIILAAYVIVHLAALLIRYREWMRERLPRLAIHVGLALALALGLAVFERPRGLGGPAVNDPEKPHVFFYCIDGLRLDRTARYNYRRALTPHLDALMDEGVVFENVFTPLAKTYPSWVSFLTATGITTHGVRFALPKKQRRQPRLSTVAGALAAAGWRTSFYTDDSRYSFMEDWAGFDVISQPEPGFMNYFAEYSHYYLLVGKLANTRVGNLLFPMTRHNHALTFSYSPDRFYDDLIAHVGEEAGRGPLASFSHNVGIHYPGAAPWPYYGMFTDSDYRGRNKYMYRVYFMTDLGRDDLGEVRDSNQHNQDLYDGMVKMMDDKFGEFTGALKELGIYDRSVIVLWSDHGEHFNERHPVFRHYLPMHGVSLGDDFQNRCVVAIKFPRSFDGRIKVRTIPELARIQDVAPTVLDALGVSAPGSFEGVSFMDRITGAAGPMDGLEIYMENDINPSFLLEPDGLTLNVTMTMLYELDEGMRTLGVMEKFLPPVQYVKQRAVRTNRWKLLRAPLESGPSYRLYDPVGDPHHQRELAAPSAETMADMRSRLERYLAPEHGLLSLTPEQVGAKVVERP